MIEEMTEGVIVAVDTAAPNPAQTVIDAETTAQEMIEADKIEAAVEEMMIGEETEMIETKDAMTEIVMIEDGMTGIEIEITTKIEETILAKTLNIDRRIEETDKAIAAGESLIDTMIRDAREIMTKETMKETINVRDHVKEAQFMTRKGIRDLVDKAFIM
jgi:hypothetical protein